LQQLRRRRFAEFRTRIQFSFAAEIKVLCFTISRRDSTELERKKTTIQGCFDLSEKHTELERKKTVFQGCCDLSSTERERERKKAGEEEDHSLELVLSSE
jgi:hypothetical protein